MLLYKRVFKENFVFENRRIRDVIVIGTLRHTECEIENIFEFYL